LPRIAEIISRERAISMTEVSKSGRSSFVLQGKTREGIE